MNSISIEGGCLCGAVRYQICSAPSVVLNCHCSDCRKASGAPFVTWAVFPRDAIVWPAIQPKRVAWADRLRLFCPECGTPLAVLPGENADIVVIAVGTMEHPEDFLPACHAWTQDRLPWVHLADALPSYVAGLDGRPAEATATA